MECKRCHSHSVVLFLDFFGNKRAFCHECDFSMLIQQNQLTQKKLSEFAEYYRGGLFGRNEVSGKLSI